VLAERRRRGGQPNRSESEPEQAGFAAEHEVPHDPAGDRADEPGQQEEDPRQPSTPKRTSQRSREADRNATDWMFRAGMWPPEPGLWGGRAGSKAS
jgi:hypothetical protein